MLQKIKNLLLAVSTFLVLGAPALAPVSASALTQKEINGQVCSGTNFDLTGNTSGNCTAASAKDFNQTLADIINILSVIVGVVAVVMIIIAGFRYITSGGAQEKVTSAKNTILYAIIGLIIVALAQIIVKFVLNKATL